MSFQNLSQDLFFILFDFLEISEVVTLTKIHPSFRYLARDEIYWDRRVKWEGTPRQQHLYQYANVFILPKTLVQTTVVVDLIPIYLWYQILDERAFGIKDINNKYIIGSEQLWNASRCHFEAGRIGNKELDKYFGTVIGKDDDQFVKGMIIGSDKTYELPSKMSKELKLLKAFRSGRDGLLYGRLKDFKTENRELLMENLFGAFYGNSIELIDIIDKFDKIYNILPFGAYFRNECIFLRFIGGRFFSKEFPIDVIDSSGLLKQYSKYMDMRRKGAPPLEFFIRFFKNELNTSRFYRGKEKLIDSHIAFEYPFLFNPNELANKKLNSLSTLFLVYLYRMKMREIDPFEDLIDILLNIHYKEDIIYIHLFDLIIERIGSIPPEHQTLLRIRKYIPRLECHTHVHSTLMKFFGKKYIQVRY